VRRLANPEEKVNKPEELAAIEVREGDVYLIVLDPLAEEADLRRYVLDLIESRGINDIDLET
jgi:hypothetical protein